MSDDYQEQDRRELPPGIVRSKPLAGGPSPPAPSPKRKGEADQMEEFEESEASEFEPFPVLNAPPFRFGRAQREENGKSPDESRITALEPQQKRKNRVNVFIDGEFAAGLFDTVAHDLGLRVGQAITPARLEEIAQAETLRRAKEDAYRLLGFRARSEKEITDKLTQKGYEAEVIALVAESLQTIGLVDDQAFAQNWVAARGKSRGSRMLAHELRQKGVDKTLAAEIISEHGEGNAEQDAAYRAAVKKVGEKPADTSREARAKLSAHLARRGFGWDIVKPVLSRLYEPSGDDDADEIAPE